MALGIATEEVLELPVLLVILTWLTEAGKLKESLTLAKTGQNSIGFDHACSEDVQTTGEGFLFVFDPCTLKERITMEWERTGRLAMMTSKPYYDKVDKLIGVFGSKEKMFKRTGWLLFTSSQAKITRVVLYKRCKKTGYSGDSFSFIHSYPTD